MARIQAQRSPHKHLWKPGLHQPETHAPGWDPSQAGFLRQPPRRAHTVLQKAARGGRGARGASPGGRRPTGFARRGQACQPQKGSGCPWPPSGRRGTGQDLEPLTSMLLSPKHSPGRLSPLEPSVRIRSGPASALAAASTPFPDGSRGNRAPGRRTCSSYITLRALGGGVLWEPRG